MGVNSRRQSCKNFTKITSYRRQNIPFLYPIEYSKWILNLIRHQFRIIACQWTGPRTVAQAQAIITVIMSYSSRSDDLESEDLVRVHNLRSAYFVCIQTAGSLVISFLEVLVAITNALLHGRRQSFLVSSLTIHTNIQELTTNFER